MKSARLFSPELIGYPIDYKSELSKFKSLVITLTLSHHSKILVNLNHKSQAIDYKSEYFSLDSRSIACKKLTVRT